MKARKARGDGRIEPCRAEWKIGMETVWVGLSLGEKVQDTKDWTPDKGG